MYVKYFKRLFDIGFSLLLIPLLFPAFVVIPFLIKRDSEGDVFFLHERNGKFGKKIKVFKFRTMIQNAIENGPAYTVSKDKRVTKIGKILRASSLDELPQIINIIKGEMSFVGPRPMAYRMKIDENEKIKLKVLPGITGYAQINGRSALSKDQKMEYDIKYVNKVSFLTDLKILYRTINVVISRKGINSN